jgi:hypothetical protein
LFLRATRLPSQDFGDLFGADLRKESMAGIKTMHRAAITQAASAAIAAR